MEQYLFYLLLFLAWPTLALLKRLIIKQIEKNIYTLKQSCQKDYYHIAEHAARNQYITIGTRYHNYGEWIKLLAQQLDKIEEQPWHKKIEAE